MKDIYRYGEDINSHDLLKILAITTMIADHVGRFYFPGVVWWRIVGRMAAPQFFFLIGYSGSYRFKRDILIYGIALFAVDFLTDRSVSLAGQIMPVNMLISFVIIKAVLNEFDPARIPTEFLVLAFATLMVLSLPTYLLIEYGTFGLCYAIGARLLRQRHGFPRRWMTMTVAAHFVFEFIFTLVLNPTMSMEAFPFAAGLLVILFATNLLIFVKYDFRVFKVRPKHLRTVSAYVSRYSLQIYFFHLSIFMILNSF